MDLVPGYSYLGRGFDGFGGYGENSIANMGRLFDTSKASQSQWTNPSSNTTYLLPENVGVGPVEAREAQSQVFDGRSEMSEFFSVQAGLKGSYLSFSGSLSASFENISKSTSEYFFGMVYAVTEGYELSLSEATRQNLSQDVLNDPDFSNLPLKYNPDTQPVFFRFFEKYGTHFVSSVKMGGRIFYNVWMQKSSYMDKKTFTAGMEVEYKGIFSVSADAKLKWEKSNESYAHERHANIQALGGNEQTLNILPTPSTQTSYADQYTAWVNSVGARPAPVGYTLTGIETLFSGDQYSAVLAAAQDYTSSILILNYQNGSASLSVKGNPAFDPVGSNAGLAYAVYDRTTLELLDSGVFPLTIFDQYNHGTEVYNKAAEQLGAYSGDGNVFVAIMVWDSIQSSSNQLGYPSATMHDFIVNLGAGDGFARWGVPTGSGQVGSAGGLSHLTYAIVGVPGAQPGTAMEDIDSNNIPNIPPSLSLVVYLRPEPAADGRLRYTPN